MDFAKVTDFIKKHAEIFTLLGLAVLFYFIFFFNIGNYPLMDVDETRYVSMARDMFRTKDFMTLYLNGEHFFEKPPLYFWLECFSFALFGKINEFTARFPVALCGTLICFLTYFMGKKIVSRSYGIVSSLILATSFEFIILAKFAILDIVVSTCVAFSIMFGMTTFFCRDEHKKFYIWLFYIFSGLAVMAKGLPGIIVPFGVTILSLFAADKLKSALKPKYFIVGLIMFLLIVLPWHIAMLNIHNPAFYEEYIVKHHLARFLSSNDINRSEPFWFYFACLLWGMIPWTFTAIALIISKIKEVSKKIISNFKNFKLDYKFDNLDNSQKFLVLNWIATIFILLFFSSSSTKLITYILPIYIHIAFILGFAWINYIENGEHKKAVNISSYLWFGLCVIAAIVAMFTQYFLPDWLYQDILAAKWLCIGIIGTCGISGLIWLVKKKPWGIFFSYVILIVFLSAFVTKECFLIDYKFGQDDLMKFAKYAREHGDEIISFGDTRRYSLMYYSDYHVKYIEQMTTDNLKEYLEGGVDLISIKNKNIEKYAKDLDYDVIIDGRSYMLIRGKK